VWEELKRMGKIEIVHTTPKKKKEEEEGEDK
jgi:hypothetical protein